MASKQPYKTTFEAAQVIRPIYTGGPVSLTDDARVLATALGDDVVLTDPSTGRHLAKIEGDGESITSLILTPSGSHLVMCSRSLGMRIYALALTSDSSDPRIDATRTRSLKPHGTPVMVLAVDATGTLLATGGTDGVVKVWDIRGGFVTHTFHGPSGLVTSLCFYAALRRKDDVKSGGKNKKKKRRAGGGEDEDANDDSEEEEGDVTYRLAQGTQSGKIKVWDLHRRAAVATLDSHVADVTALDYSPAQDCIVSASRDKTLTWWDARSWKIRKIVPCLETIEAVGFVGEDDGARTTYCAGANGNLRFWDTDAGRELTPERPAGTEGESIVAAVYRPGMPWITCVQTDHTLALYELPVRVGGDGGGEVAATEKLEPRLARRICGTHDEVIDMQYLLPDRSVMALATNSEEIRLVSVKSSENESEYFGQDLGTLKGHSDIIIALDVDWSGHWVATGAKDNTAKVWRIASRSDASGIDSADLCWATFSGHAESVGAVAFPRTAPAESTPSRTDPLSHPPPYLLTGSQDYTVKKWEVPREPHHSQTATKKKPTRALFTRKAHEKDINALDVHRAGGLFASASQDKTVKIWSLDGEVQGILRGHKRGVWSVAFAPAGTPSIVGEDGDAVAAAAAKGVVLTASGDKTIKLWSLADYTCVRTFEGHSNTVLKVCWLQSHHSSSSSSSSSSKNSVLFASAGSDGLVKIWDANTGDASCTLDNHDDRVWSLALDPTTNALASGSSDSTITFWHDTSAATHRAAALASQRLVEQEQQLENYIRTDSYRDAIALALQLNHPGRLLSIFTSVVMTADPDPESTTGIAAVDAVLAALSDDQLLTLLLRLRDWNTNARAAPVAQRVLAAVVRSYPASRLVSLATSSRRRGGGGGGGSGGAVGGSGGQKSVGEVLHALRVYTERHYKRLDELVDESYLVEYTLREMDALVPEGEGEKEGEGDVVMGEALLGF